MSQPAIPTAVERVLAYHEATKHRIQRYAAGPGGLDWSTQPDPFRRYAGADLLVLPRSDAEPSASYADALEPRSLPARPLDGVSLAGFFFESLALSAWKEFRGVRWSLRVNPSSGNLHPTEAYAWLPALPGCGATAGVFHYAPREHALERRATIAAEEWRALGLGDGEFLVGLASIPWREAWKYGERALRYCHHDVGHAVAALALAAAAQGWSAAMVEELSSEELAVILGLAESAGPEAEVADVLLRVRPRMPVRPGSPADGAAQAAESRPRHGSDASGSTSRVELEAPAGSMQLGGALTALARRLEWRGRPNRLSPAHVRWSAIELAEQATRRPRPSPAAIGVGNAGAERWDGKSLPRATRGEAFRSLARRRRSAVALDGTTPMDAPAFFDTLEATLPRRGRSVFEAFTGPARVSLALFVHRVDGLAPGLYALARGADHETRLRAASRADFLWEPVPGTDLPLFLLAPLDLRTTAAAISCGQDIAADGAFALAMLAQFEGHLREQGAWLYPELFWECGAIGQVLYLEAEARGVSATGIGCFFDDETHAVLGLRGREWQSLYHFTIGGRVDDERLTTLPAYPG